MTVTGMAEYIERETFLKDIEERYCLPCKEAGRDHNGCKCRDCWVDDMRGDVIDAPAADVAPVVHGRWLCVDTDTEQFFLCNRCKKKEFWESNYCPNCGCRMDGGDDE